MILTKIQYHKLLSSIDKSEDLPFYEIDGRFYLKETGQEVTIMEEPPIDFEETFKKRFKDILA